MRDTFKCVYGVCGKYALTNQCCHFFIKVLNLAGEKSVDQVWDHVCMCVCVCVCCAALSLLGQMC